MFKTTIAAAAAAVAFAPAAALVRSLRQRRKRAGWTGDDYTGILPTFTLRHEGSVGAASYYVQGGCHRCCRWC